MKRNHYNQVFALYTALPKIRLLQYTIYLSLGCPLFWKRFMTDKHAFCYKLVTEYLSWSDARDKCGTYGGDLVSITSHEEQVFVQQELLSCG